MPITACFSCFGLLGLLLLVPAAVASVFLLLREKKRAALAVVGIPVGMIVISILLTLMVFATAKLHSRTMSRHPNRLFRVTFGSSPPPGTSVLEAYHESIMDYGTTVMKFRTTQDVIDKITSRNFTRGDKKAFLQSYGSNAHNLPEGVRSWFLPAEQADQFYIALVFDKSFGRSEAVLCYEEKTQTAYFHWIGID
jgi:hypothetical protein